METASLAMALGVGGVGGGEGGSDWKGAWSVLMVMVIDMSSSSSSSSSSLSSPSSSSKTLPWLSTGELLEYCEMGLVCRERGLGMGRCSGMSGRPAARR